MIASAPSKTPKKSRKGRYMNLRLLSIVVMVVAAAFSRLIPHPWNFTAVGAMALFGGTYLSSKRMSLMVPMAALLLSDLALGMHSVMLFVYGAFALNVILGWTLKDSRSIPRIGGVTVLSSALFFVITNFGMWFMGSMYPKTVAGLVECYVAAIPFFGNQVAGDVFYVALMFGAFEAVKKYVPEMSAVQNG